MADYYGKVRTNFFTVTDEDKFREVIERCVGTDSEVLIFERRDDTSGATLFGFGCLSPIVGLRPETEGDESDEDYEIDDLYNALQPLISEGEAILITEVGSIKLRGFTADCTIITRTEIRVVSLQDMAVKEARAMLGNPKYTAIMHC
jgi:hypothetical protein